jgi:hypothetical protein
MFGCPFHLFIRFAGVDSLVSVQQHFRHVLDNPCLSRFQLKHRRVLDLESLALRQQLTVLGRSVKRSLNCWHYSTVILVAQNGLIGRVPALDEYGFGLLAAKEQ